MLFTKELLCLLLGVVLFALTYRKLCRVEFGRGWIIAFILLTIAGVALAFRLMGIRYLETPTTRAYGVPFVIAGGDLVNGKWADGGVGLYMPLPLLANIAFGVAVCIIPLSILLHFQSRKN